MENNRRGNEIFLGVIGVATLVVAIIGATFAFFSASASSSNGAVAANSANVSLGYVDNVNTNIKYNLIPASETVATYAALDQDENTAHDGGKNDQCVDDLGNEVCSVYEFTVSNPAGSTIPQVISISLDVAVNGFENLKYKVYEGTASNLTNASTPAIAAAVFPQPDDTTNNPVTLFNNVTLDTESPNDEKTYTIVMWLNDTGYNQSAGAEATGNETDEADKSFAATITVTSASGGVSGRITAAVNNQQNNS